jgi:predicted MFS family arabinose efflux permease
MLGALNLVICVPLHLMVVETEPRAGNAATSAVAGRTATRRGVVRAATRQPAFVALAIAFTLYSGAFAALTYHLYPLLLERRLAEGPVVAGIALIGPAQVAGRIVFWWFARNLPIHGIGMATVVALPASLVTLIVLPSSFAWLAVFAVIYGSANGVMTIVRGLAVPEMVTTEAYGELNGILAVPAAIARSVAPVAAAALWSAFGSYDLVLDTALAMVVASAASFWIAALHRAEPAEPSRIEV